MLIRNTLPQLKSVARKFFEYNIKDLARLCWWNKSVLVRFYFWHGNRGMQVNRQCCIIYTRFSQSLSLLIFAISYSNRNDMSDANVNEHNNRICLYARAIIHSYCDECIFIYFRIVRRSLSLKRESVYRLSGLLITHQIFSAFTMQSTNFDPQSI